MSRIVSHHAFVGQKAETCESKVIRRFAKGQECTLRIPGICNRNPETTVHCHIRLPGFAGIGSKPDDWLGYHGCSNCHAFEEAGNAGWDDVLLALANTQRRLFDAGLLSWKGKTDGV